MSATASEIGPAGAAPWRIEVGRPDPQSLLLSLGGRWQLRAGVPRADVVSGELGAPTRRLAFDGAAIGEWDSGLLVFLAGVIRACRDNGVEVDPQGLPDGVRGLLGLAFAVPQAEGVARHVGRPSFLARVGIGARDALRGGHDMLAFLGEVTASLGRFLTGRAQYRRGDLFLIIQEVGPQALPIVSLISFLVGLILAYMGAVQLALFGAEIYIANLVGIGMVREVAALMTGIILAGRTGAAFAAQLGTMQVNEEIDAFRTLGISPIDYLVLPRIVALVLMVPLLTLYAGIVGVLAGLMVSMLIFDIGAFEYYHQTVRALDLRQFAVGVSKGTVYGALVAFAGCLRGMQSGRSAQAVGQATTSAVVTGILLIVISASILTILYQKLGI